MQPLAPLNALRAFEAAARTGSFTNAARELGVSSAAVSQQVKVLEGFWGKTLFIRQGNRIALSEAGLIAYPQLGQSLSDLENLSNRMRRNAPKKRLVLSVPQSIAETWLAVKLAILDTTNLRPVLEIRTDDDPIDFARDRVDMRIFYGHDLYGDYRVETLFTDCLVAVASPAFVATYGDRPDLIEDRHFIHTEWGRDFSSSPNWNSALADHRIVDLNTGIRVHASSTALRFASIGFGAALVPKMIAQTALRSGDIVVLKLPEIEMSHDYRVAYPKRFDSHAAIQSIVQALKG